MLIALLCFAPVLSLADTAADNTLTIFYMTDPSTLDGQMTSDYYVVPLNIFDRLVECVMVNGAPEIVPGLAKEYTSSEDGLTWTFTLNEGVLFHNGEELTADDVVYTVNRMLNPATDAHNTDVFDMIKGAAAVLDGEADAVEGIVAIDKYTVEFTLENAYAPFLATLATPGGSILNAKATEDAGAEFGINPEKTIGTGPFIATTWDLGSEILLTRNDNYFKGPAKIDGLRMLIVPDPDTQRMLFETGQADILDFGNAPSQLDYFKESQWSGNIVAAPRAGVYYYMFNENIEPLNNPEVRRALQMGVDRQAMLDALFNGEGEVLNVFVPRGVLGFNENGASIEYNPEEAKRILAEQGYADGFTMEIAQTTDSPITLARNEVFQAFMAQIGVTVNITQLDEASYFSLRGRGELPSYSSSWSADFNDPDNFLYTFFSKKNAVARSTGYANEAVQEMLEEARNITDEARRMELYNAAEQTILFEDYACLPLFQENHLFVCQDRVKNFQIGWNGWSDMMYYSVEIE